ncbi:MAG: hypothetical protein ACJ8E8_12910 [Sphingomicrobium sp.]
MSFRLLFTMFLAAAMSFAPLAMAEAMAAAPAHHAAMTQHGDMAGHCPDQSDYGKSADKSCCAAMCLGVAIATASPGEPIAFASISARPSPDRFGRGFLGEIATPPPRLG